MRTLKIGDINDLGDGFGKRDFSDTDWETIADVVRLADEDGSLVPIPCSNWHDSTIPPLGPHWALVYGPIAKLEHLAHQILDAEEEMRTDHVHQKGTIMSTHPYAPSPQFEGQRCPDCRSAYQPDGFRVCANPACLSNPWLSDETLAMLTERYAAARAQVVADAKRRRLWSSSFKGRS